MSLTRRAFARTLALAGAGATLPVPAPRTVDPEMLPAMRQAQHPDQKGQLVMRYPIDPFTPAVELAAAIRRKEVSPVEVVDSYLERMDELDPQLNAFCHRADDEVRQPRRPQRMRWCGPPRPKTSRRSMASHCRSKTSSM